MSGSDPLEHPGLAVVVMGVSGCGKSTVASLLAEALGCSFIEADDYHSQANKVSELHHLKASAAVISERMKRRSTEGKHFMPASLLQSQLDLLQIDEAEGITEVDATICPDDIVHNTIAQFREDLASTVSCF
ncbi:gluconokinase-like [Phragmites australis]|uniref:gluconokinase-like n=1 Tax=Phragmites australis TaxID=29695 RepID=UPI002D767B12|nr:gluconokinase-like [Phragmites australis]